MAASASGRTVIIVNPASAGGRSTNSFMQAKTRLESFFGPTETRFTERPEHATALTREALRNGATNIIAVGGDGVVNEIVNGFYEGDASVSPEAVLNIVNAGTGGDFRKSFGIGADLDAALNVIENGKPQRIDLGEITFVDHTGTTKSRYFANIASFGMSGEVDMIAARSKIARTFGGRFTYAWSTLRALFRHKPKRVAIKIDDSEPVTSTIGTIAVCNGQYFGGGMHVAPMADASDGHFEVITIEATPLATTLRSSNRIYTGDHLESPHVTHRSGQTVEAYPVETNDVLLLDIDGETPGRLPAKFEVKRQSLMLRY
jgi:YegS/Rv2252/BmrU family lipid kinase